MLTPIRTLSLALFILHAPAALAQTQWRMETEYPESAMPGQGLATFARLVAEKSGGKLVIRPSYDASLGIKSADMPAAVATGRLEAADAFAGALEAVDPIFGLSSLPFLARSIPAARRLADLARPAYEKALEAHGQRLLYMTPWPASGIWSKQRLETTQDLASLSIRTYDSPSTEVMTRLGAKALLLSFADVMGKLADGSVNAVLSSGDGGAGRQLWNLLPHFTEINYAMPLSLATVSLTAYRAIPEDMRAAVDEAARQTEARQWEILGTRIEENYARMRAHGVTINSTVDPGMARALTIAGEKVSADWRAKAGAAGAAILDAFAKASP
ncbi:MAG: TRAP transporter substrate-binding protein [Hyphomicrobiales bacterium]